MCTQKDSRNTNKQYKKKNKCKKEIKYKYDKQISHKKHFTKSLQESNYDCYKTTQNEEFIDKFAKKLANNNETITNINTEHYTQLTTNYNTHLNQNRKLNTISNCCKLKPIVIYVSDNEYLMNENGLFVKSTANLANDDIKFIFMAYKLYLVHFND